FSTVCIVVSLLYRKPRTSLAAAHDPIAVQPRTGRAVEVLFGVLLLVVNLGNVVRPSVLGIIETDAVLPFRFLGYDRSANLGIVLIEPSVSLAAVRLR